MNFQQQLNAILNEMHAKGDTQLAQQFQVYALQQHALHPTFTAQEILQAFLSVELGGGLAAGIGQTGTDLGQIPGAAAKGAENAVETLGGFNLGSWFLRIGEILLGLVLVGVGVARITGAQNVISKALKVIPK